MIQEIISPEIQEGDRADQVSIFMWAAVASSLLFDKWHLGDFCTSKMDNSLCKITAGPETIRSRAAL
jgi:hypothetical protein